MDIILYKIKKTNLKQICKKKKKTVNSRLDSIADLLWSLGRSKSEN